MRKAFVIARREYLAMVGSKAFVISLAVMPIFMVGGAVIPQLLKDRVDVREKQFVVLDQTGTLLPAIREALETRNRHSTHDPTSGKQVAPEYRLADAPAAPVTDELRLQLSDRVKRGELYAFVEIPADVLEMPRAGVSSVVSFYGENTALSDEKRWFEGTLTELIQSLRMRSAGIDPTVVAQSRAITFEGRGLFARDEAGGVKKARDEQMLMSIFLPMGIMMFMFMIIMMSAQPMLETVLEEKTNRIAEVLLGSASPLEIMTGKLFGNVAGSLTVAVIYLTGGYALARYNQVTDLVPFHILPWFAVFQVLAVLMFSSMFMAIGAAVNQLKEAQSLLLPVWVLIVLPLFVWINVVREPNSSFATWLSLIPPFIPMLMCLRLASTSAIPLWQPLLGLAIMVATTGLCVFASSRVFRIGMLTQGRAPKLNELLRWAITG
ncbi:MAG: ABC transporter permease [Pirellulaceae bacterium]|jgi:ABC-type Na+ efflux pump permease subunit|nr:ABC transporter permease [Pirellulaceae bacterium]